MYLQLKYQGEGGMFGGESSPLPSILGIYNPAYMLIYR